jgi:hypothetical protein
MRTKLLRREEALMRKNEYALRQKNRKIPDAKILSDEQGFAVTKTLPDKRRFPATKTLPDKRLFAATKNSA